MKVIITDCDDRKALSAIRSLGRRGAHVCTAAANKRACGLYSRYSSEKVIYPSPATRPDEYAAFILDFVSRNKFDCLLPMSDYTCLPASRHKESLEKYVKMPVPDYETARLARDKFKMAKLAESLGIAAPKTFAPADAREARVLSCELTYPCVVKFRTGTGAIGIRYPNSPDELVAIFEEPRRFDPVFIDVPPIIQEFIPGKTHDLCALFNGGRPRAALTHVRLRTWPASGGRGITNLTTDEPELREMGFALLTALKWHGPAQVEFKLDDRDRKYKLMDINARFWGGIDEGVCAGIDWAWLAARMAVDRDVEPHFEYPIGMYYRWPFPHEFTRIFTGPGRLAALKDFFRLGPNVHCDLRPSDPLPHIVDTAHAVWSATRRILR